jgi:branched-chain amino acid transport system permease protein
VSVYLSFIILGLASGAVYVVLGNGLLLVYRASGVVNFAQAALALWGACVYAQLRSTGDLVFPVYSVHLADSVGAAEALAIALGTAAVLGLLAYLLVFRLLRAASTLGQVVASVALMISVEQLVELRFGGSVVVPSLLPASSVKVAGASLNEGDLYLGLIAAVLSVMVWFFLNRTTIGIATRGSASNERAIALTGQSPTLLGSLACVLATVGSTLLFCLAAPSIGLDPPTLALYVVPGLAILLLARMKSVLTICVAGLALGSFQAIVLYLSSLSWWPTWAQSGVGDALPFVLIVITLYVFGRKLPARGRLSVGSLPEIRLPRVTWARVLVPSAVCVGALFALGETDRFGLITSMCLTLLALSYVIVTGYLGQISLAQASFAGAAGFALNKVGVGLHWPFPVSFLAASAMGAALGLLMAVPALRIRGTQLAIVTLAGGVAIEDFVFDNPSLTQASGNPVGSPSLFGLFLGIRKGSSIVRIQFGILVLVILVLVALLIARLATGETGRAWLAVRANERSAAAAGIDVRMTKFVGFALSGFIAGMAGCLISYSQGEMSSESFTVAVGLQILAVVYIGGISSILGACIAGFIGPLGILYVVLSNHIAFGEYYPIIAGLGLLLAALLNPDGAAGKMAEQREWLRKWVRRMRPLNEDHVVGRERTLENG